MGLVKWHSGHELFAALQALHGRVVEYIDDIIDLLCHRDSLIRSRGTRALIVVAPYVTEVIHFLVPGQFQNIENDYFCCRNTCEGFAIF